MKKILVPIDFSQQAKDALSVAQQLARKFHATLSLVHVLEIPLPTIDVPLTARDTLPMDYLRKAREGAEEQMQTLVKRQRIKDVPVAYHVQTGNPYRSIINELLKEKSVDLVVMGSKGTSGDKEILVGSNAERMVRFARCPVLVVKGKVKIEQIKNIVFATTLREYDNEPMKELKALQQMFGAHLHLLRVNTLSNFLEDPFVRQRLRELAKTHHLKNYTVHTYSDLEEEEGIIHFAQEVDADLIALTTRWRHGLAHLFSGSVAEDVANHTKLPVWTLSLRHTTKNQNGRASKVLTHS